MFALDLKAQGTKESRADRAEAAKQTAEIVSQHSTAGGRGRGWI